MCLVLGAACIVPHALAVPLLLSDLRGSEQAIRLDAGSGCGI